MNELAREGVKESFDAAELGGALKAAENILTAFEVAPVIP
jgi:hypothetical protein